MLLLCTLILKLNLGEKINDVLVTGATEDWNGISWSETTDLSTARGTVTGAGTSTAGLAIGGQSPPYTNATEEWSGSSVTTKTIDTD